jgi:hypothetical protein
MEFKYQYKVLDENGKITMLGQGNALHNGQIEITKEEYVSLLKEIREAAAAHQEALEEYIKKVQAGEMEIADVPEDYQEEVEFAINPPEPEPSADYLAGYDQAVLDMMEV